MMTDDHSNSLFQRAWWLDAVAPGQWAEALVVQNGETVARMPYMLKRRMGVRAVTMPPLTPFLGPWLKESEKTKLSGRLSDQKSLMNELIDQLPPFDLFNQAFHYSVTNWLPFYWRGFQQTTVYSYVIEELGDLDEVWAGFDEQARRAIRKSQKTGITVEPGDDVERFFDLNQSTFSRQDLSIPYDRDLVRRIDAACVARQCRRIFFARGDDGRYHAALYLIWDGRSAYYLMGGADPDLRSSGAGSLLMWEAIQFAATVTKVFDFEGSIIEPIERFFRSFGGRQVPYFRLRKQNRRFLVAEAGRKALNRFNPVN